ncbi:MAG: hypothetical protein ACREDR_12395 [Blastocatellia bacterium]
MNAHDDLMATILAIARAPLDAQEVERKTRDQILREIAQAGRAQDWCTTEARRLGLIKDLL